MDLKTYLSAMTHEQREEFALKCETTKGHLQNVMYGLKSCATDLAVLIERNSALTVRRWDLRALDWFKHWPELVKEKGAPKVPKVPTTTAPAATENVAHSESNVMQAMLAEQRDRAEDAVAKNPDARLPKLILKSRNDAIAELAQAPATIEHQTTKVVAASELMALGAQRRQGGRREAVAIVKGVANV